jgi:hypothetical protein
MRHVLLRGFCVFHAGRLTRFVLFCN